MLQFYILIEISEYFCMRNRTISNHFRSKKSGKRLLQEKKQVERTNQKKVNLFSEDEFSLFCLANQFHFDTAEQKLILFLLISMGVMACLPQAAASTSEKNMQALIDQEIKKICTEPPFAPVNKPANIQVDSTADRIIPRSCALYLAEKTDDVQTCNNELLALDYPDESAIEVDNALVEEARKISKTKKLVKKESEHAKQIEEFTPEQGELFNHYVDVLDVLEKYHAAYEYAPKIKKGRCGEFAGYVIFGTFATDRKYNTTTKIQDIYGERPVTYAGPRDHNYALFNSSMTDVTSRSPKHAQSIVSEMKSKDGKECDAWNKHYEEARKSDNAFYTQGLSFVRIRTLSITYDFSKITSAMGNFIEKHLKRFGLEHKIVNKPEEPKETKQLKNEL